ncbi:MAG: hypothetical protein KatS3mg103_1305 [Phycisphaerales bacterium]|nr:MAG: hypothetical protein KatS3mg103_1305 [Phycisphaerales bacterium]
MPIDDGELTPPGGLGVVAWTVAMAYLKARSAIQAMPAGLRDLPTGCLVLSADTACELDGRILGKPADQAHARAMLQAMQGTTHAVATGVALVHPGRPTTHRLLLVDVAHVRIEALPPATLEAYLASGQWQGKAGGYNLHDRLREGWPITVHGDPDTVVGLPAAALPGWLAQAASWAHGSDEPGSPDEHEPAATPAIGDRHNAHALPQARPDGHGQARKDGPR